MESYGQWNNVHRANDGYPIRKKANSRKLSRNSNNCSKKAVNVLRQKLKTSVKRQTKTCLRDDPSYASPVKSADHRTDIRSLNENTDGNFRSPMKANARLMDRYTSPLKSMNLNHSYTSPMKSMNLNDSYTSPMKNINLKENYTSPMKSMNLNHSYTSPMKSLNLKESYTSPMKDMNLKDSSNSHKMVGTKNGKSEAFPHRKKKSAFSDTLSLFSPQKKIAKRVSKQVVVETIFSALFKERKNVYGGDDGDSTDTDGFNEDFVKKSLEQSLFKSSQLLPSLPREGPVASMKRFITPGLIHKLVMAMRYEDFRTASARLDIIRAIHRTIPDLKRTIAKALMNATMLRLEYVRDEYAERLNGCVDEDMPRKQHDHAHGFVELLRFLIEHLGNSVNGFKYVNAEEEKLLNMLTNSYARSLVAICKAQCLDAKSCDAEELMDCFGQFVAYVPTVSLKLFNQLLQCWPVRKASQELFYLRIVARILQTVGCVQHFNFESIEFVKVFQRIAACITNPYVQLAQESMHFATSVFVLNNYIARRPILYTIVSKALHTSSKKHWNHSMRVASDQQFDIILDFAP